MNGRRRTERRADGSAVVDFVLILALLIPLVLGLIQLALVLHVRNVLSSAAAEGARVAGTLDGGPAEGLAITRSEIRESLDDRYAGDVSIQAVQVGGAPGYRVRVRAAVPALGLGGPAIKVSVAGNAVRELP